MLQIALQPVWEGLADRQWTEADLGLIESELGKLDFRADYQFAMRGERACDLWFVDYIRKTGFSGWKNLGTSQPTGSGTEELENSLGATLFPLVPAGWFDQNKLSICRNYQDFILPVVDRGGRIISPSVAEESQDAIGISGWRPPYDVLSVELLPSLPHAAVKFARGQSSVDLARLACALERCRLANGQFPETLDALAPKFIADLPHDVINGQPLKYHRTEDGQFVLYSVGWNRTDDGGKVGSTKHGQPDLKQGDWVWQYPGR